MDNRLRALERRAACGDPDAVAQLTVERVRSGQLDSTNVALAAHFGHPAARRAYGRPDVMVKCQCARSAERRVQDGDGVEPFQTTCFRCQGTGTTKLPDNLMEAVKMAGALIADSTLLRWSIDCVEHVRSRVVLEEDEVRLPNTGASRSAWMAAVTWAYRFAGHRASEREWQKQRLGELLLG